MNIAILLFDRFTALDAVGPYEVLTRIPGATVTFVAEAEGPVRTDTGRLAITADATIAELTEPEILLIPGGPGQTALETNPAVLGWIRHAHETTTWTTSVCTGSLVLGAAGLLEGKKATSHWLALDQLEKYGATPTLERVVIEGKIITAAGVSSGIDMALTLVAKQLGDEVAQAIQLGIEYDPQPPFDAGSPEKAPAAIREFLEASSRFLLEGV
jgi:transcriptional regulator GlxA family with amidase domain